MPSPFPGMDPFIEACGLWEDFHAALIHEIKYALIPMVPERYVVRTGERSYLALVESGGRAERSFLPDVSVSRRSGMKPSKRGNVGLMEPESGIEPVTMRAFIEEEHREAFIDILETTPRQRLVTSIEVLSPSNKRPGTPGWDLYRRKRQSLLLGSANLVEIDLLRGGSRMPMLDPWPKSPYTLLVARAGEAQSCQIWPIQVRQAIPRIPVPLAKPDADVWLKLQPLIATIYERSRYDRSIDYTKRLRPPLDTEDNAWWRRTVKGRTKRTRR